MSSYSDHRPISSPLSRDSAQSPEITRGSGHSYGQILKSSAWIGGSSAASIVIGMVRTKAMAVFLGPAGFGLMGLYGSIVDLAQSLAGMGVNGSGVRQIAEAVGSGETERIARTVVILRRASLFLGLLGAVFLFAFSVPVSVLTFGNEQHAAAVALLSLAVFFRLVSAGQGALIQGMRRISDLAGMGVLGALFGAIIGIPVVYLLREEGVAPSLVGISAMMAITSWWFSRKVKIPTPAMTVSQIIKESAPLLKLGFSFMASGILVMGSAYAVLIMVLRTVGFEEAGFYQSAWTLGGLYVGFILQAMGADFYPRLTAVANDNGLCNRLVNEQAKISLLLAGPGVIFTLTFAPMVVALFYTAEFVAAVDVLRWICLGMALRVITWPIGFIILAKGRANLFFWTESAWTAVHLGLAWICISAFGLDGAGIAFLGSYIFQGLLIYPIVRRISGFRWSAGNLQAGLLFLVLIAGVFSGFHILSPVLATSVGVLAVILSGIYSIRAILDLVSLNRPSGSINSIKQLLLRIGFVR